MGLRLITGEGYGRGGSRGFGMCSPAGDVWGMDEILGKNIDGVSHESEHDLAVMVSDFLENGSTGTDSWYSSDSDSGFSDLSHLAEKITFHKLMVDQLESDLLSVVQSFLLSIGESDLHLIGEGSCNGTCIRQCLAKLLHFSGYDAALCLSKWQGSDNVPGGDHEYIDVNIGDDVGGSGRMIIDLDFRSHFEIARAVDSYDVLLKMLPVVFVGSLSRLKHLLQVMAEAAKFSLKQNSMPLPPWRSLSYLEAKWCSAYKRELIYVYPNRQNMHSYHKQCIGHLRRLKSSLKFEIEKERLLKPIVNDKGRRMKADRLRTSFLRV